VRVCGGRANSSHGGSAHVAVRKAQRLMRTRVCAALAARARAAARQCSAKRKDAVKRRGGLQAAQQTANRPVETAQMAQKRCIKRR